jgi:tripartite-type tricarboxylate transporter receptor subunit TctC
VLVVSSQRKIATLRQFVDWAHRHPVTFASLGVGSGIHMNALRFAQSADISAINVPFKGAPEALAEVMSGRIDFCFCAIGTALPYIRSGALTALAVGTKTRSKLLPDVPTTLEAGYAGSAYVIWLGVLASRNAPREHIAALGRAIAEAMKSQSVRTRLLDIGIEPLVMPAEDFEKFLANDREDNAAILKAAGLSMP